MYKDSLDIRHKEFIGVVLPDPRKEENGMFGGMMGGLIGVAAIAMTGGLAGVAMGAMGAMGTVGTMASTIGSLGSMSGFGSILSATNLVPSAVSMGMSSLSGGSFLNFGGALTGMIGNTPQLAGLMNSFNTISEISNGFAGLSSTVMGLGNGVANGLGALGNFAQNINSTLPSGITNTLFNSIGLNVNDLSISNEISANLGIGSSPVNLVDIHNFNGMASPMRGLNGAQDISSVKGLGNQVATEPDGNIKVLVHVPELMYHIDEDKGIWCFNRLVTTNKSSSATSSGMLGALSKGASGFSGGSALSGGNVGSALGGMTSMGNVGSAVGGAMFGPVGSAVGGAVMGGIGGGGMGSTVGTAIGTMVGGPIGGMIGGAIGGMLGGDDEGSGSDGAYGPLQPGAKVFIRFTENDFNTGNIVGVVHQEEDPATGGSGGTGGNLLGSVSGGIGALGSMSNIGGFTNTISDFSSSLSGLTNTIGAVSGILNSANSFANSITNAADVISDVANHAFQSIPFVSSVTNTIQLIDNVASSISDIGDIVI